MTTKERDKRLWELIEQHSRGEIKTKVLWKYLEKKYEKK